MRFEVIGDAEPGRFWFSRALFNKDTGAFWKLLRRADRAGADFIVQLGDMVSRGTLRNFLDFFLNLRVNAPRTPYLTVIGNHDRHAPHGGVRYVLTGGGGSPFYPGPVPRRLHHSLSVSVGPDGFIEETVRPLLGAPHVLF